MGSQLSDVKNFMQFRINAQSLYTFHLFVKRHQQSTFLHKTAKYIYVFQSADFWSGPELALEASKLSIWISDWSDTRSIPSTERIRCFTRNRFAWGWEDTLVDGQEWQTITYSFTIKPCADFQSSLQVDLKHFQEHALQHSLRCLARFSRMQLLIYGSIYGILRDFQTEREEQPVAWRVNSEDGKDAMAECWKSASSSFLAVQAPWVAAPMPTQKRVRELVLFQAWINMLPDLFT